MYLCHTKTAEAMITSANYHLATTAIWTIVNEVPANAVEGHCSLAEGGRSNSCYWITETGVYRASDHWGYGVASCAWHLNVAVKGTTTRKVEGDLIKTASIVLAFCAWEDFYAQEDSRKVAAITSTVRITTERTEEASRMLSNDIAAIAVAERQVADYGKCPSKIEAAQAKAANRTAQVRNTQAGMYDAKMAAYQFFNQIAY